MSRSRCPYKFPARSRQDMIDAVIDIGAYRRFHDTDYPVSYNVKVYPDLDADTLWKEYAKEFIGEAYSPQGHMFPEQYLEDFKRFYLHQHKEHAEYLFDWGLEDARRGVLEDDTYRMLWDGTMVDVEWVFTGRSGGYLCPAEIDGYVLRGKWEDDFVEDLKEMPFSELRVMYKFLMQCKEDFGGGRPEKEVQHQAAFNLMVNVVIPAWESEGHRLPAGANEWDAPDFKADWEDEIVEDLKKNVS